MSPRDQGKYKASKYLVHGTRPSYNACFHGYPSFVPLLHLSTTPDGPYVTIRENIGPAINSTLQPPKSSKEQP